MRKYWRLGLSVMAIAAVLAGGCATGAKGPSDEELIDQMLNNWKVGMETKDITKIDAAISEQFNHYEWGDKKSLIAFVKDNMDQGNLDGAKIVLDNAKKEIDKDAGTAKVYPVELSASFGSMTIEFNLKKETDGAWRAVGLTAEGV